MWNHDLALFGRIALVRDDSSPSAIFSTMDRGRRNATKGDSDVVVAHAVFVVTSTDAWSVCHAEPVQ